MSKLTEYSSKAPFMTITLEIDGQHYSFNLDLQLKIQEEKLNTELKEHARSYAFLCMLRNKVIQKVKKAEREFETKKAKLFNHYMETLDKVTEANKKVAANKEVNKMAEDIDTIKELRDVLDIAVNAFNQRKDLLQTLSSNLRTEKPK